MRFKPENYLANSTQSRKERLKRRFSRRETPQRIATDCKTWSAYDRLWKELKKTQESLPQCQAALDRFEFEQLRQDRETLTREVNDFLKQLEALFGKIGEYNTHSLTLAGKIVDREYQLKGYPNGSRSNGNGTNKVHQLAQPFDLNHVRNSLTEVISELISRNLST
jgi:hypothetical protein